MKRILLALVMMCGSAIAVEYGNFWITSSNSTPSSVTLNEGDIYVSLGSVRQYLILSSPDGTFEAEYIIYNDLPEEENRMIVGPAVIAPNLDTFTYTYFYSYKIISVTEAESSASPTPLNIISLPADNNGDIDLLIETSTDLQSWTPIYSDSIGTTGTASFIRTRLIQE